MTSAFWATLPSHSRSSGNSKIPGYAGRVSVPNYPWIFGVGGVLERGGAVLHAADRRSRRGSVGGVWLAARTPFRIDHDEKFNLTTHLQYQPWKTGPWFGFNWRYDSGLVAGSLPCCWGKLREYGPLGSDSVVDTSILSPDQQFEAGLFCGSIRASRTSPIGSGLGTNLCPAAQYGSTLMQVPAPERRTTITILRGSRQGTCSTSRSDTTIFSKATGTRSACDLRAINITNKYALYNFLSTFSGTHYVTPRALTAELGFHF